MQRKLIRIGIIGTMHTQCKDN